MDQKKETEAIWKKTLRCAVSAVSAVLCGIMIVFLLSSIFLGSSFGGLGKSIKVASYEIMSRFDIFITNTISTAMDGVLEMEKIYLLSDNDQVAPEPNQQNFGSTTDEVFLKDLIEKASGHLDGQELFFNTERQLLENTSVNYYLDDSIFALTWKQPIQGVIYTFAEVKIQHPTQFRRFLADGVYGSDKQYLTSQMAASVNAVVASAGDFYKYRPNGLLVYHNQIERFNGTDLDSCFIDTNGDLLFSKAGELQSEEELQEYIKKHNVRFSLCFGPVLIEDGKSCVPDRYPIGEISGNYSRSALCQLGSLHYLLVTVNDEPGYPWFPTLYTFADSLIALGIEKAYTLDGGQTATIVMNDQVINRVSYGAERYISDIIYFATAIPDFE